MTIRPPLKTDSEVLKITPIRGGDVRLIRGIDGTLFEATRKGGKITVKILDDKNKR